jgi:hypothetical protein
MDLRRGLFLGVLVAALALPTAAQAAVRCVPVSVPGCTTAHATINAAVLAAVNDDTIQIAAGTYAESITTTKRLNFVGAGAGTLNSAAGATVIAPASGYAFNLPRGGSLRSLRAVGSTGFTGSTAISLAPDVDGTFAYTLTDVIGIGGDGTDITLGFGGYGLTASSSSAARIVNLSISGGAFRAGSSLSFFPGTGLALYGAGLTANLTNTSVVGATTSGGTAFTASSGATVDATGLSIQGVIAAQVGDSTITLRRSRVEGVVYGLYVYDFLAATPTAVTVADSLVTVTPTGAVNAAALSASTSGGASNAIVNLRGSTVIARGVDPQYAVVSRPASGAPAATIDLRNTIARLEGPAEADEADVAADRGTVTATYSDFATRLQLNGGTVTEPGSPTNLTADPLFDAGAFTLQSTSPLIDRGDPSIVAAGQLDLAGNPRAAGAAPDIGAFEFQPPAPPPPPPNAAPGLTKVTMTNTVFAPVAARAARRHRAVKRGTTFRYTLSEPATVTLVIERGRAGRRVHGRCVKPTHKNAKRRACKRWRRVGTLRAAEQAGRQSTRFGGRFGKRALAPGRYRARIRARDALGARSAERRLAFRIVRAR